MQARVASTLPREPGTPPADLLFDPLDPAFRDDPYPHYARLRREDPVHWTPLGRDGGSWVVSRYEDCLEVLGDPRMGMVRSDAGIPAALGEGSAARVFPNLLIFKDAPEHTRLRQLVSKAFTPRAISALRPRIRQIVEGLLDAAQERGSLDLMADFAFQLPVLVICEMLGVPAEDRHLFKRWTPDFSRLFESSWLSAEELERCDRATKALCDYFEDHVSHRKAHIGDDLLSILIQAEENGDRLGHDELIAVSVQLLNAGYETTMGLIGNSTLALLENRDQFRRMRLESDLVANAVEEALRYDSPVQYSGRIAKEDVEIRGTKIAKDQVVFTILGSANRDPDYCDYPDHFDITRYRISHLAFGFGAHFCLGAHLARLEAEVALGALAKRFPGLELATDRRSRRPSFLFRTLESLPLVFNR